MMIKRVRREEDEIVVLVATEEELEVMMKWMSTELLAAQLLMHITIAREIIVILTGSRAELGNLWEQFSLS
jgi:hypothetical protein